MKQYLLTKPIGRVALRVRDKVATLRTAWFSPESVGTLANDLLATRLVTSLCKPNATFIDVGAHIGSIVADVRHEVPSSKIIAMEAIPEKIDRLRRAFPFVEVHGCAVGESTGEIAFFIDSRQSGYSSLAKPADGKDRRTIEIKVPLRRLDDIVSASDVDVIKIDVEGAELGVLRGGDKLLARCRPVLMFESGPEPHDDLGYTPETLFDFLASRDYGVVVPNRVAHTGPGLTRDAFTESHCYPRRTTNYFAIPNERRIEIRMKARAILRLPPVG